MSEQIKRVTNRELLRILAGLSVLGAITGLVWFSFWGSPAPVLGQNGDGIQVVSVDSPGFVMRGSPDTGRLAKTALDEEV